MASITLRLSQAAETHRLGQILGQHLPAGTVLLLEGDLGSGKTTLVQGLGAGLGITDTIDSPTFTLINEYLQGRVPLYHVDLYRLSPAEVDDLYLETYWEGQEVEPGILAIEWADRLRYLPEQPLRIELSTDATGGRQAILIPTTAEQARWLAQQLNQASFP
jgi:tRNA threonylcarbamoyladenosine biosynthesis protein TsaE